MEWYDVYGSEDLREDRMKMPVKLGEVLDGLMIRIEIDCRMKKIFPSYEAGNLRAKVRREMSLDVREGSTSFIE